MSRKMEGNTVFDMSGKGAGFFRVVLICKWYCAEAMIEKERKCAF
jgi:hypothetical protein